MRILYVITRSDWGGAQDNVYKLIKGEVARENEIYLATGEYGDLNKKVAKLKNTSFFLLNHLRRQISPVNDLLTIFELVRLFWKVRPDIVHIHSSKAGIVARLAGVFSSAKIVFTVHGYGYRELNGVKRTVAIFIERFLSWLTDELIFVSRYDYEAAKKDGALGRSFKRFHVIYNGLNLSVYSSPRSKTYNENKKKIVMVARFGVPKRQDLLIKAFLKLNSTYQLYFVGEGPNFTQIKEKYQQDSIHYLGFSEQVNQILKQMDALILISDFEAFPLSVIEGMATGLPIIASKVGGIPEAVVDGKNGYLVDNAEEQIVNAIKTVFANETKYKAFAKSSREFSQRFDINTMISQTHDVYL